MTSSGSFFSGRFDEKMASNASVLEVGGTVVVTEIGRWMEKNDATWTSSSEQRKVSSRLFLCGNKIIYGAGWDLSTNHVAVGAVSREHLGGWKMRHVG
jgi:hypothetical protein